MKRLIIGITLALLPLSVCAEEGSKSTTFEQISVSSAAVGLTTSNYDVTNVDVVARTKRVTCAVESNSIRFRTDGVNPTASVGYPVAVGSQIILDSVPDIIGFKAIRQSADATLSCIYWR